MKRLFLSILVLISTTTLSNSAVGAPPTFTTLEPGQFREVDQNLQINIVFVGYEQGTGPRDINEAAFRAYLPLSYRSVNRVPRSYGLSSSQVETGTTFSYNYNIVYADLAFENVFFNYISLISVASPRTSRQDLYNLQPVRSLDIGQNHQVNATATERWLAENAPGMIGVDTTKYTIFFVNWFGRPDFRFHTYIEPGQPDVDSGFNYGLRDKAELIAWGGTTADDPQTGLGSLHRVWFYDLSAGPEFWTDNWNLTDADVSGDSLFDYRMPPIWEYGNLNGYRPFDDVSGDLGAVSRFVAINLLFTASPIYKVELPSPKIPKQIQLDISLYEADATFDARSFFDADIAAGVLSRLQPQNSFTIEETERDYQSRAAKVFDCWASFRPCYGGRGYSSFGFYDLYAFHSDHLTQSLEGDHEYEIPIFIYTTPNTLPYLNAFFGGVADDNYSDGTQQHIYIHQPRFLSDLGHGLTYTVLHEAGHHLSLSHPHDGYDSELNIDYGFYSGLWFAWSGDESATSMSYHGANTDFSQFDRDNIDRNLVAAYINRSNELLPRILAKPNASDVNQLLTDADQAAAAALAFYQTMDYRSASAEAQRSYEMVLAATAQLNIQIEREGSPATYRAHGPEFRALIDDGKQLRRR